MSGPATERVVRSNACMLVSDNACARRVKIPLFIVRVNSNSLVEFPGTKIEMVHGCILQGALLCGAACHVVALEGL